MTTVGKRSNSARQPAPRTSHGGALLLLADREPQSPQEWGQWLEAARKQAGAAQREPGTTDEPVVHLVHFHCWPRRNAKASTKPGKTPASP